jgi:uncharacterized membrane protein
LDQSRFAGKTSRRQRPAEWKWLARFWHLHFRLVLSAAFGTAVSLTLYVLPWPTVTRLLVGWDSGVVLYLALIYWDMAHASVARMRQRAAIDDEGAIGLLVLTTTAALASLAAVVVEIGQAPGPYHVHVVLGMATILLSWTFMHSIFALHYAREFFGKGYDERTGGLVFPGKEDPDYWDFLYYSLVVAMTAQVSDVQITSKTIRRLTTVHGVSSFFFNLTVLALTVNIVSSLMQGDR